MHTKVCYVQPNERTNEFGNDDDDDNEHTQTLREEVVSSVTVDKRNSCSFTLLAGSAAGISISQWLAAQKNGRQHPFGKWGLGQH